MIHEGQHLVVQVGIDENFHELKLESLLQMFHHRREPTLVLAKRVTPETGSKSDLQFWRSPETVPDSV